MFTRNNTLLNIYIFRQAPSTTYSNTREIAIRLTGVTHQTNHTITFLINIRLYHTNINKINVVSIPVLAN